MDGDTQTHCINVKASDCPIKQVTVYKDRAEVCRVYEGAIEAGTTELHITHFVAAHEDSIRVEGKGKATIGEVIFQTKRTAVEDAKTEEEKALEEKYNNLCKELTEKNAEFALQYESLKKRWRVLEQFVGSASSFKPNELKDVSQLSSTYFTGMRHFLKQYGNIGNELDFEKKMVDIRKESLEKKVREVNTQLTKLRTERHCAEGKKECVIVLEATESSKVVLSVSYIVPSASWVPSYDLRMSTDQGILKIFYYGLIRQNTGEDWTKVKLSLSTAEPSLAGTIPVLTQTLLSVAPPVPSYNVMSYSMPVKKNTRSSAVGLVSRAFRSAERCSAEADRYEEDAEEILDEMSLADVEVTEGRTSASYEIARLSTIPSDNSSHKVTVTIIETQPVLTYVTVPRVVPQAFLEAKLTNSSPYILLAGATNIFLDNSCVGKARLRTVTPKEELECSLGVDPGVKVTCQPSSKSVSSQGIINKLQVTQHEQVIEVKNTHGHEVKVKVTENLPKSQDERIKVNLLCPSIDPKKPEKTKGNVNLTKANHVEWHLTIPPMEKAEAVLRYTVEHPPTVQLKTSEVTPSE